MGLGYMMCSHEALVVPTLATEELHGTLEGAHGSGPVYEKNLSVWQITRVCTCLQDVSQGRWVVKP